jgi:hypothetical protein
MAVKRLRHVLSSAVAVSAFLAISTIALSATLFAAAVWRGCPPYQRISKGMTKEEVRYILGRSARLAPIGSAGDWRAWRVFGKFPEAEAEAEEELWSTRKAWIRIGYDDEGKVLSIGVRHLNRPAQP